MDEKCRDVCQESLTKAKEEAKKEVIDYMISVRHNFPASVDLAMHASDMFELWDGDDYPAWLEIVAEDIFQG